MPTTTEDFYNASLLVNGDNSLVNASGNVSGTVEDNNLVDYDKLTITIDNVELRRNLLNELSSPVILKARTAQDYFTINSVTGLSGEDVIDDFSMYHNSDKTFSVQIELVINDDDNDSWLNHHTDFTNSYIHLDLFLEDDDTGKQESSDLNVKSTINAFDPVTSTAQEDFLFTADTTNENAYVEFVREIVGSVPGSIGHISILDGTQYTFDLESGDLSSNELDNGESGLLLREFKLLWNDEITNPGSGGRVRNLKLDIKDKEHGEVLYTINSEITVLFDDTLPYSTFSKLSLTHEYSYKTINSDRIDIIYKSQLDLYKQAVKTTSTEQGLAKVIEFINEPLNGGEVVLLNENDGSVDTEEAINTDISATELDSGVTYNVKFGLEQGSDLETFLSLVHNDSNNELITNAINRFKNIAIDDLIVVGDRSKLLISPETHIITDNSMNGADVEQVVWDLSFADARPFKEISGNLLLTSGSDLILDGDGQSNDLRLNGIPELSGNFVTDMSNSQFAYELTDDLKTLKIYARVTGREEANIAFHVQDNQLITYSNVALSLSVKNVKPVDESFLTNDVPLLDWSYNSVDVSGGYKLFPVEELFSAVNFDVDDSGEVSRDASLGVPLFNEMVRVMKVDVVYDVCFDQVNSDDYVYDASSVTVADVSANGNGTAVSSVEYDTDLIDDDLLRKLGISGRIEVHIKLINSSGVFTEKTINFLSDGYNGDTVENSVKLFDEVRRTDPAILNENGEVVTDISLESLTLVKCSDIVVDNGRDAYEYNRSEVDIVSEMIQKLQASYKLRNKDGEIVDIPDGLFVSTGNDDFDLKINLTQYNADKGTDTLYKKDYDLCNNDLSEIKQGEGSNKSFNDEGYELLPVTITAVQDYVRIEDLTLEVTGQPTAPDRKYYETVDAYESRVISSLGDLTTLYDVTGGFAPKRSIVSGTAVATDNSGNLVDVSNSVVLQLTVTDSIQNATNSATGSYIWQFFTAPTISNELSTYWNGLKDQNKNFGYWLEYPLRDDFVEDVSRNYNNPENDKGIPSEGFIITTGTDGSVWGYQISYSTTQSNNANGTRTFTDTVTVALSYIGEGQEILNGDANKSVNGSVSNTVTYIRDDDETGLALSDISYSVKPTITYSDDYVFDVKSDYGDNTTVSFWNGDRRAYSYSFTNDSPNLTDVSLAAVIEGGQTVGSQPVNNNSLNAFFKFKNNEGSTTIKSIPVSGLIQNISYTTHAEIDANANANEVTFRDILSTNELSLQVQIGDDDNENQSKRFYLDTSGSELINPENAPRVTGSIKHFTLISDTVAPLVSPNTDTTDNGVVTEVSNNVLTIDMENSTGNYKLHEIFNITDISAGNYGDLQSVTVTYGKDSYGKDSYVYDEYKTGTGFNKLNKTIIQKTDTNIFDNNTHTLTNNVSTEIRKGVPGYYNVTVVAKDDHDNKNVYSTRNYTIKVVDTTEVSYTLPERDPIVVGVNNPPDDNNTPGVNHLGSYIGNITSTGELARLNNINIKWTSSFDESYRLSQYYNGSTNVMGRVQRYPLGSNASGVVRVNNNTDILDYSVPAKYVLHFSVTMPSDEENGLYTYAGDQSETLSVKVVDNTLPEVVIKDGGDVVNHDTNLSVESASGVTFDISTNNAAKYDLSSNKYVVVTSIQKVNVSNNTTTITTPYTLANVLRGTEVRHGNNTTIKTIPVDQITSTDPSVQALQEVELLTYATKTGVTLDFEELDLVTKLNSEPSGFKDLTSTNDSIYLVTVTPVIMEGNYIAFGSSRVIEIENQNENEKEQINAPVPEQVATVPIETVDVEEVVVEEPLGNGTVTPPVPAVISNPTPTTAPPPRFNLIFR